jgi:hypothetical protein
MRFLLGKYERCIPSTARVGAWAVEARITQLVFPRESARILIQVKSAGAERL